MNEEKTVTADAAEEEVLKLYEIEEEGTEEEEEEEVLKLYEIEDI